MLQYYFLNVSCIQNAELHSTPQNKQRHTVSVKLSPNWRQDTMTSIIKLHARRTRGKHKNPELDGNTYVSSRTW
jgi:hypothetical protein